MTPAVPSRVGSTPPTAWCSPRRPGRPVVHDRRVRHQRPAVGRAPQLHLGAHVHDRRLLARAGPGGRGRPALRAAPGCGARRRVGPRHPPRARRHRVRVHRGSGVDRRSAAVQRTQLEHHLPLGPRGPGQRVPHQERLLGPRHRPLPPAGLERTRRRTRRSARHLPARQPPHRAGQPARRPHRVGRPLRRQAPQQPQRPRVPLRRHAVLHRPAVRVARPVRRRQAGAATSVGSSGRAPTATSCC